MRSGVSGRHCSGSKARAAAGAVRLVVGDELRPRPAPRHVRQRRGPVAVVDEAEAGDAARGRHHDRLAERRGVEAVAQDEVVAAIVAGRQRLVRDEQVVQPARTRKPDVVGRVEHAGGIAQKLAGALDGDRLQERLRRQAGPTLEHMLEVGGRQSHLGRDLLDRGLVAPAGREEFDRAPDGGVVGAFGGKGRPVEHGCGSWRHRPESGAIGRRAPPENDGRAFTSPSFRGLIRRVQAEAPVAAIAHRGDASGPWRRRVSPSPRSGEEPAPGRRPQRGRRPPDQSPRVARPSQRTGEGGPRRDAGREPFGPATGSTERRRKSSRLQFGITKQEGSNRHGRR